MTDRDEFINREILPVLGDYADDFDLDAICDEVATFDATRGYVWAVDPDDVDAMGEILARHDTTA